MNYFDKMIQTSEGNKEFKFKIALDARMNYIVSVEDENYMKIHFRMLPTIGGNWIIAAQKLPEWIFEVQSELNYAIKELEN